MQPDPNFHVNINSDVPLILQPPSSQEYRNMTELKVPGPMNAQDVKILEIPKLMQESESNSGFQSSNRTGSEKEEEDNEVEDMNLDDLALKDVHFKYN